MCGHQKSAGPGACALGPQKGRGPFTTTWSGPPKGGRAPKQPCAASTGLEQLRVSRAAAVAPVAAGNSEISRAALRATTPAPGIIRHASERQPQQTAAPHSSSRASREESRTAAFNGGPGRWSVSSPDYVTCNVTGQSKALEFLEHVPHHTTPAAVPTPLLHAATHVCGLPTWQSSKPPRRHTRSSRPDAARSWATHTTNMPPKPNPLQLGLYKT
jgi:hypothetical protein